MDYRGKTPALCPLCGAKIEGMVSFCQTCEHIRLNYPEIFGHIQNVSEYSWEQGMHEAAHYMG